MIEQVGTALLNNGPIGILCVVLWLQNREAMKREDRRNERNEQISKDRIAADLEMAKSMILLAERIQR